MKAKLLGVIAASLLSIAAAPTLRAATFLYDVDIVRPVTFPGIHRTVAGFRARHHHNRLQQLRDGPE
jgi:hypothetical protein